MTVYYANDGNFEEVLQYVHTEGCINVHTIETLLSDNDYELYSSYVHKRLLKFDQNKT